LGAPASALAAVAGTSVFASLGGTVDPWLKIAVGMISIAAAVLTGLQTFYNFPDLAERHRSAGTKYKAIRRELEQMLIEDGKHIGQDREPILNLRGRLDDLESGSPVVDPGIQARIDGIYERGTTFVPKATDLYRSNAPTN
jgi:hypothetical protein